MTIQQLSLRFSPENTGVIHIIGIGGIGMSGIAEIMNNLGYQVQGSDASESPNVERLRGLGIKVCIGQDASNVDGVKVVVKSSAIKPSNPEIQEARKRRIPVVSRAEMLAEIMRLKTCVAIAGTHGKTTITTMMTTMFMAAGLDPTFINGGIINAYGTNAKLGQGNWLVAEADESDGTFMKLPATIGTISNIDPEHLEHYGSFENLQNAFATFINNIPFYGFCVACVDHPEVKSLVAKVTDRKVISYGIENKADVRAVRIKSDAKGSTFDVEVSAMVKGGARVLKKVKLPMPGYHNVLNALSPIAVLLELGIDDKKIIKGYEHYRGVKRRFTVVGEVEGITVVDDYGHHPTEIKATLATAKDVAKNSKGRVIAVVQPHRYSRVKELFEGFCSCFADADLVIVSDIYAAGEEPLKGITQQALIDGIKSKRKAAVALESPEQLPSLIHENAKPGDIVVCLGAGSVTYWAQSLPKALMQLFNGQAANG